MKLQNRAAWVPQKKNPPRENPLDLEERSGKGLIDLLKITSKHLSYLKYKRFVCTNPQSDISFELTYLFISYLPSVLKE